MRALGVLLAVAAAAEPQGRPGLVDWLKVPAGFEAREIASDLPDARGMKFSPDGELYVNQMDDRGKLVALKRGDDGTWSRRVVVLNLNTAHSLAFWQGDLWVAETDKVRRFKGFRGPFKTEDGTIVVGGLPTGGHVTRTILPLDDRRFLLAVGSSCNACLEQDKRRAAISAYNADGTGQRLWAEGLRNAVGLVRRPGTDEVWATCNGRDWLGDELPPECVYRIEEGKHYGWPFAHADGLRDKEFGRDDFKQTGFPQFMMPAHCAPLGLAFYDGTLFPAEYRGDLFVCLHGSWNRSSNFPPQVIRVDMKLQTRGKRAEFAQERFQGPFVTGFLTGFQKPDGTRRGRPVDAVVGPDGALYVSDDARGSVYRVAPAGR